MRGGRGAHPLAGWRAPRPFARAERSGAVCCVCLSQRRSGGRDAGDPEWHFRVDIRSDAGASWLISGEDSKASATASTSQVSVGWTAVPNESGVSYALPRRVGTRLELGPIAAAITMSGSGARVLFRLDQAAVVIDGASSDGFVRKLLGGRPIREPVAWMGPFVMNTREEVLQAMVDYQAGRLGSIPAVHNTPTTVIETRRPS